MIIYEEIFKKYGLSPTQQEILKITGQGKTILEIGSSAGYMTRAFLDNDCIVDVVEKNVEAFPKIPDKARKVFKKSIEEEEVYSLLARDYQFIVMADVLEHLVNPEQVLKKLARILPNAKLLISLPNIACWVMRKQLFFKGEFEYQKSGLLDETHLHFYTFNSLPKMLSENGWKVDKIAGTVIRLPLQGFISKIPVAGWFFKKALYQKLISKFKNLAYYHFLVIASKK